MEPSKLRHGQGYYYCYCKFAPSDEICDPKSIILNYLFRYWPVGAIQI